jgi:uncharacterized metal-binding protein YceD (DUF177 family)
MTPEPEFSRPLRLDQIGAGEQGVEIAAEPAERAALARRFGLADIGALSARFTVRRDAAGVVAVGQVQAEVVQRCVASGEPVPARVDEAVTLRFLPEPDATAAEDEVELSEAEADTVFYTGGAIDLGEAAAESMALALDPFPRAPGAAAALKAAGVLSEEEAAAASSPFAGLVALRDQFKAD